MSEFCDLPNGWELKKLIDVCEFINGRAYKKEELLNHGKYPVLRVGNFFTNNNWYYSDLELPENKYCNNGDLLYAWSASFGPKIWDGEKSIYHYHIWKIIPDDAFVLKKYLYQLLDWDVEQIKSDQGSGATMMHVTKGSMESRVVPIPPLPEQQRIVSKLDLLFQKIDKSIELHQKNMDEANAFMGSVLNEVFGELEEKYEKYKLDDLTSLITKGTTPTTNGFKFQKSGINFLKIENIVNGKIDLSTIEMFISEEAHQSQKRSQLEVNDVLFSIAGTIGDIAIVKQEHLPMNTNQAIALIRPIEKLNPEFLRRVLSSSISNETRNKQRGGAIKNVSLGDIKEMELPLPPLHIQQKVVEYLDSVSEKMEKVKSIQKEKMESLKALKASILDKAFRGEL
jgi:type I restriction enzyme S subunit